jgi:hypothetical protein
VAALGVRESVRSRKTDGSPQSSESSPATNWWAQLQYGSERQGEGVCPRKGSASALLLASGSAWLSGKKNFKVSKEFCKSIAAVF